MGITYISLSPSWSFHEPRKAFQDVIVKCRRDNHSYRYLGTGSKADCRYSQNETRVKRQFQKELKKEHQKRPRKLWPVERS